MNSLSRYSGVVFGLLRLIVGLLFACHGGQKILGVPPGGHGADSTLMVVGGWIELVAGLLIAVGLFTRIAAFIASGEMAVAYFMVHAPGGFYPVVNHGDLAVVLCFLFLFIFFHGAGPLSLDAILCKKQEATGRA